MLAYEEIFLRLLVSAFFGSLIGLERQRLHWAAGLRTHMLVCVASTLIMITSAYGFTDILRYPNVVLDPSRIAAQVVSGIGFLGAGTILLMGQRIVRGLTTAASLWAVAGIGLAVGSGLYFASFATTVLLLFILAGIKPLEKKFLAKQEAVDLICIVDRSIVSLSAIQNIFSNLNIEVVKVQFQAGEIESTGIVQLALERSSQPKMVEAFDNLSKMPGVLKLEFFNHTL